VCSDILTSADQKHWSLLLKPVSHSSAAVYFIQTELLDSFRTRLFSNWLAHLHRLCLRSMYRSALSLPSLSLETMCSDLLQVQRAECFQLWLVLDLDKTLILNERDHLEQVRAGVVDRNTKFEPDFTLSDGTAVEIRGGVDDFLRQLAGKFRIYVLSAGSFDYAQKIVEQGNLLKWRSKRYPRCDLEAPQSVELHAKCVQRCSASSVLMYLCLCFCPVRIEKANVWSSRGTNSHDATPVYMKHLALVFGDRSCVQASLIVDDSDSVWHKDERRVVYPIQPASVSSTTRGAAVEQARVRSSSPTAHTGQQDHFADMGDWSAGASHQGSAMHAEAGIRSSDIHGHGRHRGVDIGAAAAASALAKVAPAPGESVAEQRLAACAKELLKFHKEWSSAFVREVFRLVVSPSIRAYWGHLLACAQTGDLTDFDVHRRELLTHCRIWNGQPLGEDLALPIEASLDQFRGLPSGSTLVDAAPAGPSQPPLPKPIRQIDRQLHLITPQELWSKCQAMGGAVQTQQLKEVVQRCSIVLVKGIAELTRHTWIRGEHARGL
jgi:hypothetical protein